ncbi:MAG TPA: HAMP domain-containing sensor histidine kinase [Hyphomicrobium sp.]|jgi:signal transduction histidine kinase
MAWTTSACLRAQLFAWELTGAQIKKASVRLALLHRSLRRPYPTFAFALLLAALGFLTLLLPQSLTAGLLLSSGALLALLGVRSVRSKRAAISVSPGRTIKTETAITQNGPRPTAFKISEIALEQITQRALIQPRLAAKRNRLAPQRDRTWAELMSRVNHDLRTPLNAVIGFSELMVLELFGPLGDDRYQDYAQHIRDSATDLLKSAEDTLALTALTADPNRRETTTACDLEHSAGDAWSFLCRKAAARAITFVACLPPGIEVLGEPRTLRQTLVNMLSEAVARAAHGERVMLTATIEGELVELAVTVSKERSAPTRRDPSLAICLARTLLEMQGTSLLEVVSSGSSWRAVTVLDRAVQPDFFTDREPFGVPARQSSAAFAG